MADRRKARGDQKGAAELSIRVGTLDPDDLEARIEAARSAVGIGDVATALREFRDVATRLGEAGREDERVDVLAEVAALDGADGETAAVLARAYVARGDLGLARRYLNAETAGDDPGLWLALAETPRRRPARRGREAGVRAIALDAARRGGRRQPRLPAGRDGAGGRLPAHRRRRRCRRRRRGLRRRRRRHHSS